MTPNRPKPRTKAPPMSTPTLTLRLHHAVQTAVRPTPRVSQVAAMFGLGVDQRRTLDIVPETTLTLGPGKLLFVTGASGGGKTTMLRLIAEQARVHPHVRLLDFEALDPADEDRPLVEAVGGTLEAATRWLALAGLNDAFVMLRRPRELSDGQRYRFRLARAIADMEQADPPDAAPAALHLLLADEFAATLDRPTAMVIARNVRKWLGRPVGDENATGVCFVAATTHDDLLEPLNPDTLIIQRPGEGLDIHER